MRLNDGDRVAVGIYKGADGDRADRLRLDGEALRLEGYVESLEGTRHDRDVFDVDGREAAAGTVGVQPQLQCPLLGHPPFRKIEVGYAWFGPAVRAAPEHLRVPLRRDAEVAHRNTSENR